MTTTECPNCTSHSRQWTRQLFLVIYASKNAVHNKLGARINSLVVTFYAERFSSCLLLSPHSSHGGGFGLGGFLFSPCGAFPRFVFIPISTVRSLSLRNTFAMMKFILFVHKKQKKEHKIYIKSTKMYRSKSKRNKIHKKCFLPCVPRPGEVREGWFRLMIVFILCVPHVSWYYSIHLYPPLYFILARRIL